MFFNILEATKKKISKKEQKGFFDEIFNFINDDFV